jgi:D-alanyl-D-alanine carboxypeptidase
VIGNMVLQPLGLNQTTYPTDATIPSPSSRGYFSRPNFDLRDVTASNPAFAGGAGAMISTLGDLMVWARALATGSLLSPTTQAMRLQTEVLVETPKVTVAVGMGITNINGFLGHDGVIVGYGSLVLYLPSSGATIVLMGNNNDNNAPAPLAIGLAVDPVGPHRQPQHKVRTSHELGWSRSQQRGVGNGVHCARKTKGPRWLSSG